MKAFTVGKKRYEVSSNVNAQEKYPNICRHVKGVILSRRIIGVNSKNKDDAIAIWLTADGTALNDHYKIIQIIAKDK